MVGRQVYFVVIQIYKKFIYNIVKELRKTMKKSMAIGISQESCTALFPLCSFRKNDISKIKKYIQRENVESIERVLIFNDTGKIQ